MKEIYNRLLRLALTVGLTEREASVKRAPIPATASGWPKAFWPPSRRSGTNCC